MQESKTDQQATQAEKIMTTKTHKCQHCGDKNATTVRSDCKTWGRKVWLCDECKANGK